MLVCIGCVGRGIEVLEEGFEVGIEIEFGVFGCVRPTHVVFDLIKENVDVVVYENSSIRAGMPDYES